MPPADRCGPSDAHGVMAPDSNCNQNLLRGTGSVKRLVTNELVDPIMASRREVEEPAEGVKDLMEQEECLDALVLLPADANRRDVAHVLPEHGGMDGRDGAVNDEFAVPFWAKVLQNERGHRQMLPVDQPSLVIDRDDQYGDRAELHSDSPLLNAVTMNRRTTPKMIPKTKTIGLNMFPPPKISPVYRRPPPFVQ